MSNPHTYHMSKIHEIREIAKCVRYIKPTWKRNSLIIDHPEYGKCSIGWLCGKIEELCDDFEKGLTPPNIWSEDND